MTRRRTREEEAEGTQSVLAEEEMWDGEPKEKRPENGCRRTLTGKLARDDREGERHMQKLAAFQDECGPTRYVNRTREGEGKEDHGSGEDCFCTTEACTLQSTKQ
ncbi:hypothetical protein NDU88_000869 [Pleurodeles waltl]|uniref:Uncharacterized protein n=1 Tax=Pleurodeles waltl TaxID=8319 RepID=A0AAV7TG77_PLEWA|nr:hypothetical protein NDU88_000869 [Pleurodeles waltl]